MRFSYLFLSAALGALSLTAVTPATANACCGWGWGWGYGYGPPRAYYYPRPMYYYAPPAHYMPGQPVPGTPPTQSPAPRLMPTPSVTVGAKDDAFDPANATIQVGQSVTFVNNGKHVHTVTSKDGHFDSGDIPPGGSFSVTFNKLGTYRYHCKHHKGMEGTIVVGQTGSKKDGGAKGVEGN